jgi:hypothetical protein
MTLVPESKTWPVWRRYNPKLVLPAPLFLLLVCK